MTVERLKYHHSQGSLEQNELKPIQFGSLIFFFTPVIKQIFITCFTETQNLTHKSSKEELRVNRKKP